MQSKYASYLNDESGLIKNAQADGIFFPKNSKEIMVIVKKANGLDMPITVSGGGTGISGGRVPLQGWIIATDKMIHINRPTDTVQNPTIWIDPETGIHYEFELEEITMENATIRLPIAMPLICLQRLLKSLGWFFGPDPTERSAFIGGNAATNASGARSFKYGAFRNWIEGLDIVLPTGELLDLDRNTTSTIGKEDIEISISSGLITVPRPTYTIPRVRKNVAGPVISDDSHVLDLFIGSEGIFGIITELKLRLIRPPSHITSLFVYFDSNSSALKLIELCQQLRADKQSIHPMSVEYLDHRAIAFMRKHDGSIHKSARALVILEQDSYSEENFVKELEFWDATFSQLRVLDTSVGISHKEIEHHKLLRHCVPETVNSIVRNNGQPKIGSDFSVPDGFLNEFFLKCIEYGETFEQSLDLEKGEIGYALWAHAGDTHFHLNLIPKTARDTLFAKSLIVDLLKQVVFMGGSIAAEHGIGKKKFGDVPMIVLQFDEEALHNIRKMKSILDPHNLLNRGNLIN